MKTTLPILFLVAVLVAGCNRPEDSMSPVAPSSTGVAQVAVPDATAEPVSIPPEEWANHPIFKKPNPYDLPLEIEVEMPELPPEGVMEPAAELPPQ